MNIILFGPPGVGKSTLIGILKSKGFRAIDLEDVYPSSIRFQLPSMVKDTFIGAADLNPARKYKGMFKVLLYAQQSTYDQRRSLRDSKVVGKANQMHHLVDQWKINAVYDYVLDTTNLSPTKTANVLIKLKNGNADRILQERKVD